MRAKVAILLSSLIVAACVAGPPGANPARPRSSAPTPSARATKPASGKPPSTAEPSPVATPGGSKQSTALPPVASRLITGKVRLDASYLVSVGAGQVLSNAGGRVFSVDSRLISDAGGFAIGEDGSTLLGVNGSGLIGNNGGGVISNNGGGAIAMFGLLQAAPTLGEELPAEGLAVRVFDPGTGQSVLASRDPAIRATAFAMTDATGTFAVPILLETARNLMIVAAAGDANDVRRRVDVVLPASASGLAQVDLDTQAELAFLRAFIAARFEVMLLGGIGGLQGSGLSGGVWEQAATPSAQWLNDALREARTSDLSEFERARLAQRLADLLLGDLDLSNLVVRGSSNGRSVREVLTETSRAVRVAAVARMQDELSFFTPEAARARGRNISYVDIRRPADVWSFFIRTRAQTAAIPRAAVPIAIFEDLGLGRERLDALNSAIESLLLAVSVALFTTSSSDEPSPSDLQSRVIAVIRADVPRFEQVGTTKP